MTRYAFHLDSSGCSGCKACQVACKDKHDLPLGVLWRRVYEVTGGGWERRDGAWLNDVYAYNVSMACNHCERPICLEVCPTAAIGRREDGIVLIDADRCMGCRYCEWACPYGALQYHAGAGRMTKCTLCVDELEAGRSPACVAACPLRVLSIEGIDARRGAAVPAGAHSAARRTDEEDPAGLMDSGARTLFPLPDPGLTEPAFRVTPQGPHGDDGRAPAPRVANGEEVGLALSGLWEPSLVAFTLLAQAAVGMLWALLVGGWLAGEGWFGGRVAAGTGAVVGAGAAGPPSDGTAVYLATIAALTVFAMAISFLHLGRPRNARRALANLRRSWLSREVLFVTLFAAGAAALFGLEVAGAGVGVAARAGTGAVLPVAGILTAATAVAGAGLVHAMARVYRLRTVPAWDTVRTTIGFFVTAVVVGTLALILTREIATFGGVSGGPGTGGSVWGVVAAAVAVLVTALAAIRARTRFYASHRRVGV